MSTRDDGEAVAPGKGGRGVLLYDTLTRNKELFVPRGDPVTIYVCGITPYDTTHLGHAFTYVFYDVLIRYLRYQGHVTRYVQNVTDVDDDILRRAREIGVPWDRLAIEQTQRYQEDMTALNVLPPDVFPRASQEIPKIIDITRVLLQKGYAYRSNGNVYFQVRRDPSFGRLSHIPKNEMLSIANQRGNNPNDPHKRNPLDFVLWQHSRPEEPRWDSPWGHGRPGWHIECSAMALRYLGNTVDIHGGGADLIFPHHEGEIVESENYTGKAPFVRHWVHTAMVYLGSEKMSKSLGNLVMVRDLLSRYSTDAVRLLLLSHRHIEPWGYEEKALKEAEQLADLLRRASRGKSRELPLSPAQTDEGAAFLAAMDDDLNTPQAICVLREVAERIVRGQGRGPSAAPARSLLRELAAILGLRLT